MHFNPTLYLVTDSALCPPEELPQAVERAILGGVSMVQLREKHACSLDFYNLALRVKEVTARHNIPLLINDRVDIAIAADADGVHIGQSDLPAKIVRRMLGDGKILGVTAATPALAIKAQADGADYIGCGAVFPTATKKDAQTRGVEAYREVKRAVKIPAVAIGGIQKENVHLLAGCDGIAVVSAVMGQADEEAAARELLRRLRGLQ